MPHEDGEIVDVVNEEEMMEELVPTPRPIPITGTALIVPRFIVIGDTAVELEILPIVDETAEENGVEDVGDTEVE